MPLAMWKPWYFQQLKKLCEENHFSDSLAVVGVKSLWSQHVIVVSERAFSGLSVALPGEEVGHIPFCLPLEGSPEPIGVRALQAAVGEEMIPVI